VGFPPPLYKQHGVDAAVVLRVVSDLCVLAPDHLAARRDETQLADVDLDNRALGDHTQLRVQRRTGVLLHADNRQAKSGLQLRAWVQRERGRRARMGAGTQGKDGGGMRLAGRGAWYRLPTPPCRPPSPRM